MVTSSHRDQLRRTSQVPTSNTASHRKSGNLKRMAPSKPPVSQTKQQSKKGTDPTKPTSILEILEAQNFIDYERLKSWSF